MLCNEEDEAFEHLFFGCRVSQGVWQKAQNKCAIYRGNYGWGRLGIRWRANSFGFQLRGLVLAVTVYELWQARNDRLFQAKQVSPLGIMQTLTHTVQYVVNYL